MQIPWDLSLLWWLGQKSLFFLKLIRWFWSNWAWKASPLRPLQACPLQQLCSLPPSFLFWLAFPESPHPVAFRALPLCFSGSSHFSLTPFLIFLASSPFSLAIDYGITFSSYYIPIVRHIWPLFLPHPAPFFLTNLPCSSSSFSLSAKHSVHTHTKHMHKHTWHMPYSKRPHARTHTPTYSRQATYTDYAHTAHTYITPPRTKLLPAADPISLSFSHTLTFHHGYSWHQRPSRSLQGWVSLLPLPHSPIPHATLKTTPSPPSRNPQIQYLQNSPNTAFCCVPPHPFQRPPISPPPPPA